MQNPTLLSPLDFDAHPCGYCGSKSKPASDTDRDSSHTYGAWAHQLNPADYRALMDRGWRRSGAYLYKPRMSLTCCPQYTIRLPVHQFKPSKQHRQAVNKVRRYLNGEWTPPSPEECEEVKSRGETGDDDGWEDAGLVEPSQANLATVLSKVVTAPSPSVGDREKSPPPVATSDIQPSLPSTVKSSQSGSKPKPKPKNTPFNLRDAISDLLTSTTGKHTLRTVLELASNTPAKFALYDKYQTVIHRDAPGKNTPKSFARFLVDSPLNTFSTVPMVDRSASPLANGFSGQGAAAATVKRQQPRYGSFHLCYYLDARLVGVSVIDIVPGCVSSVYFFYDPDVSWLGLGKVSAMVEAVVAMEEHQREQGAQGLKDEWYLYMGYYVPGCTKMIYKAQFKPSQLMDPVNYQFYTIDQDTLARLDASDCGFTRFDPAVSLPVKRTQVPDAAMDRELAEAEADALLALVQGKAVPMAVLRVAVLGVREQPEDEDSDDDMLVEMKRVGTCAKKMDAATAKRIVFAI